MIKNKKGGNMKRFNLFVTVFFLLFINQVIAGEFKLAVVDLQRALITVESGKKAKSQLEKEFNAKKKELDNEENEIRKMTEEFKKKSMVLSEDAKRKKEAEIQERIAKFRELYGKSQMEIQNRERELTEPLILKLKAVVEEVAAAKNYTLVFEKNENALLYSAQKDDITDEVIKAFNKKHTM
jgi:outer membrane protein